MDTTRSLTDIFMAEAEAWRHAAQAYQQRIREGWNEPADLFGPERSNCTSQIARDVTVLGDLIEAAAASVERAEQIRTISRTPIPCGDPLMEEAKRLGMVSRVWLTMQDVAGKMAYTGDPSPRYNDAGSMPVPECLQRNKRDDTPAKLAWNMATNAAIAALASATQMNHRVLQVINSACYLENGTLSKDQTGQIFEGADERTIYIGERIDELNASRMHLLTTKLAVA